MAADSKILRDAERIFKTVRQRAVSATLATLEAAAQRILLNLDSYREYSHVTGNTWTSTTVGIFYKGELKALYNKGAEDEPPTRVTLREGERYNLPEVYEGGESHGYVGEEGEGGQWGPTLGPQHIRSQHVSKRNTWSLVVVIPVSYAVYNPRIVATMQNIMDGLPDVLDYSIVTINRAGAQGNLFNELPF